jgi:O-acetyl-ADP-ribose deacetylase (regulator of RNase III)
VPIIHRRGSIFTSDADVLVNTVNCSGVMGAGIAREMRLRYPEMFERYRVEAELGRVVIGQVFLDEACDPWILNFPTKKHWRHPSRVSYLRLGLEAFERRAAQGDFESAAFPLLGASHGGIEPEVSRELMVDRLQGLPLEIEIWEYDRKASDDLLPILREALIQLSDSQAASESALGPAAIAKVREAVSQVNQLGQLADLPGLGERTIERLFAYAMRLKAHPELGPQPTLGFDLAP